MRFTNKLMFATLPAACGLLLFANQASAGVLYSTGFEAPTFTIGPIAGQDGWSVFGPGVSTVENFDADSGSQALFVDGSTATQSGPFHEDTTTASEVELMGDIFLASSSTQTEWQFGALGAGLSQFLGGIDINADNSVFLLTGGDTPLALTWTRDTWHSVGFLFNIATQTYSVDIDGTQFASGVAFCGDNNPCLGANVAAYGDGLFDSFGGGNALGLLDNFSVSTVDSTPEPASLVLMGMGLFAIEASRRLSRRKRG